MEMLRGEYPYKNSDIKHAKHLFENVAIAQGKMVALSTGGYNDCMDFAFRIYFDNKKGVYNCQVCSEARTIIECVDSIIFEHSVVQEKNTTLDSVITAILYNEYTNRVLLKKRSEINDKKNF